MGTIKAKISDKEEERIKKMAEREGYTSVSDYIRDVLRDRLEGEDERMPEVIIEEKGYLAETGKIGDD